MKVLGYIAGTLLVLVVLVLVGWFLLWGGQLLYETFGLGGVLVFCFGMFGLPSFGITTEKRKR